MIIEHLPIFIIAMILLAIDVGWLLVLGITAIKGGKHK